MVVSDTSVQTDVNNSIASKIDVSGNFFSFSLLWSALEGAYDPYVGFLKLYLVVGTQARQLSNLL